MTVVSRKQAEELCPDAFNLKSPKCCDGCGIPFTEEIMPIPRAYGPFTIQVCCACSVAITQHNTTLRSDKRRGRKGT